MKQRKHASEKIACASQQFMQEQAAIGLFMPLSYEPDITSLYHDNDKMNRFALPKVISKTSMAFVWWDKTTKFQTGAFSILEPSDSITIDSKELSVIFVPLVAFNHRCERLGHGKGYYDRYLRKTKALKIGVAFSCQQSEDIQCFAHDVVLDVIITEKDIFYKDA